MPRQNTLSTYNPRSVTAVETHEWCSKLQKPCNRDAPNGYIITIQNYRKNEIIDLGFKVEAHKFVGSNLLLQVNTRQAGRKYRIENGGLKRI